MRLFRAAVLATIVLGASASLLADGINDPQVIFNKGGNHSVVIGKPGSSPNCNASSCIEEIPDAIVNGQATVDVHNMSGLNIIELLFFIPTDNFDQSFDATTNLFLIANITPDVAGNQTIVQFGGVGSLAKFATGNGSDGTASIPPPLDSCGSDCLPGFASGSNANPPPDDPKFNFHVEAFFGKSNGGNHPGLLNGQEGTLTLVALPEPGTFALMLGAIGFIAASRKLRVR